MYLAYNNADLDAIHDAEPTDRKQDAMAECPTCHEYAPFVWHGHHAVASSPEDDDPWCKHCNRPLDDFRSDNPADYCAKAPDAIDAAIARVEANHADDDLDDDRTPHPRGFARTEQTWLP